MKPLARHSVNILDVVLPARFTDSHEEYRYARESAALADKNYRAFFNFTGPDRVRYLNAVLTNNIRDLLPGQGIPSLLLNPQGHIVAETRNIRDGGQAARRYSRHDPRAHGSDAGKIHHHG